jgi:aspartyl-tRNA(Asn)/glutamyl-tRNA(Gln) amidotransferase subunit C
MALTPQDISRIANLARLELSSPTKASACCTAQWLLRHRRADAGCGYHRRRAAVHPVAAIQDVALRLRDDVVSEPNQREANQRAPRRSSDGLFLVPKVIE